MDLERIFVDGCGLKDNPLEILNWYRNLYYKENTNSERGIMANAINSLLVVLHSGDGQKVLETLKGGVVKG